MQPLVTASPAGDARLPIECDILDRGNLLSGDSIPGILVSCQTSTKVGGFGRAAQATCLLDQVIRGLTIADVDSRLLLLQGLDEAIQAFLSLVLPHGGGQTECYCVAVAITTRWVVLWLRCFSSSSLVRARPPDSRQSVVHDTLAYTGHTATDHPC
jgi:hypothetical protein